MKYDKVGQTNFKCGGYTKNGTEYNFTCPLDYTTKLCGGYKCDWSKPSQPTCKYDDQGTYKLEAECKEDCKPASYAKCNPLTSMCEPCSGASANCTLAAYCNFQCSAPKAKCNTTTKKCFSCSPAKDADCKMTAEDCDRQCANTISRFQCNTTTKKCFECSNATNAECRLTSKATCDTACNSSHPTPTPPPSPPTTEKYFCNETSKKCQVWTKDVPEPPKVKSDCERDCNPMGGKCDTKTWQCVPCEMGTVGCSNTLAWCQFSNTCVAPAAFEGVWRGNEISKGFQRGEWDLTFTENGKALSMQFFDTKVEKKWHATIEQAGDAGQGAQAVKLVFTEAPQGSALMGQSRMALLHVRDGAQGLFQVLSFAIAKGDEQVTSFDAAMTEGSEFTLIGCHDSQACDFSKARVVMSKRWMEMFI